MQILPNDVWLLIIKRLDLKDVCVLLSVSQAFHKLGSETAFIKLIGSRYKVQSHDKNDLWDKIRQIYKEKISSIGELAVRVSALCPGLKEVEFVIHYLSFSNPEAQAKVLFTTLDGRRGEIDQIPPVLTIRGAGKLDFYDEKSKKRFSAEHSPRDKKVTHVFFNSHLIAAELESKIISIVMN